MTASGAWRMLGIFFGLSYLIIVCRRRSARIAVVLWGLVWFSGSDVVPVDMQTVSPLLQSIPRGMRKSIVLCERLAAVPCPDSPGKEQSRTTPAHGISHLVLRTSSDMGRGRFGVQDAA